MSALNVSNYMVIFFEIRASQEARRSDTSLNKKHNKAHISKKIENFIR